MAGEDEENSIMPVKIQSASDCRNLWWFPVKIWIRPGNVEDNSLTDEKRLLRL
jgi:hypothetical protein